jgi:hypothetical protein
MGGLYRATLVRAPFGLVALLRKREHLAEPKVGVTAGVTSRIKSWLSEARFGILGLINIAKKSSL